MKTVCNVAGVTFRVKESEAIRKFVPEGECELRHVPFEHPSDPNKSDLNAVEVWNKGLMLGYLPKNKPQRKAFFEAKKDGIDVICTVKGIGYAYYDGNLNIIDNTFNDLLEGYLGSVELEFESAVSGNAYTIKGLEWIRVTKIAGLIDNIGFLLPEHLYNWMTRFNGSDKQSKVMTHKEYLEKVDKVRLEGNALHDACEAFAMMGVSSQNTPHGLDTLFTQYNIRAVSAEQVVKRGKKYRVAGRYDLLADVTDIEKKTKIKTEKRVIIDWKRGSSVKLPYLLQCAFYAKQTGASEFWIVLFGTKNKCGYSVKKYGPDCIPLLNEVFDMLTKIAYKMSAFKEFKAIDNV